MAKPARQTASLSRSPGRPREFDVAKALDKATKVFSERGFHGTSIADLTHAMNLAQGSIYKAFEDKRGLFLAALQRYRATRAEKLRKVIGAEGSGLAQLRRALGFYVQSSHGEEGRRGCLVVTGATELSAFSRDMARDVAAAFDRNEALLMELVRRGQKDGSIAAHIDARAAARMMLCLTQGMRVVGKTGRTRADMQAVVDLALTAIM
ncbi:TetR/AcrR family transcriptional regulator [Methylovirgula sp. 4M-Z18]|uniref:TetR/AcrR family transcriptional regulator n=1 Tax=Methylovirgula sp. 4M-Z18 TaxID=2293567 RepID=UPI000E2EECA5|nr:TetR/AcrR family transcriptional regulator [Methylovirgula sp. 4M-Z18]RFB75679.1 TetR/AcrR family transcriptional regulator [Methylovirgula sp. 4M-Z18]